MRIIVDAEHYEIARFTRTEPYLASPTEVAIASVLGPGVASVRDGWIRLAGAPFCYLLPKHILETERAWRDNVPATSGFLPGHDGRRWRAFDLIDDCGRGPQLQLVGSGE